MPYTAYQWFNRHMSFSEYTPDDDQESYDRFRKRRIIVDIINAILPKTYYPHQDVGLDEKVLHSRVFSIAQKLVVPN